ncbi:MAG: hypothetical protein CSB44_05835 [Gammaproteobacteria bacterium]|nr:MAG: hypothetical protein CSB44_05835 [Gammaproteobacteria bacterium]
MSFDSLGLRPEILAAITDEGYDTPTPIQLKAIPLILGGSDLMASAQTGTGKTAAFTLPMLHRLSQGETPESAGRDQEGGQGRHTAQRHKGRRPIRALVLTPTRELAAQVGENVAAYGRYLQLRSTIVFGGVNINPQIQELKRGVDILVATPGRLLDHASQGNLDLSTVEYLVFDEADRMLDMGFIHDIKRVLKLLPDNADRQNLLFSATFSKEIRALADRLLDSPERVEVSPSNRAAERVTQAVYRVEKSRKRALLSTLIREDQWSQVLVFMRTKHGANRLAQQLERDGITAMAIHGNKSQSARTRALAAFKAGELTALVATDIAARGLDIDQLPHVVNYELPNVPADYVHRIGRTARAGREGEAVSLVSGDESGLLRDIERLLGNKVPVRERDGFEPGDAAAAAAGDKAPCNKSRGDKARGDKARGDKARGDKARGDKARGDKARGNTSGKADTGGRSNSRSRRRRRNAAGSAAQGA